MKTIFLTIGKGGIARNILRTGVFPRLRDAGLRIVIITPAADDLSWRKEFASEHVVLHGMIDPGAKSGIALLVTRLYKLTIFTETVMVKAKLYGGPLAPTAMLVRKCWYLAVGRARFLRAFVRWLDATLLSETRYDGLFASEKPSLLFATGIYHDADAAVMKAARRHGVPIVGMYQSWDNPVKEAPIRVVPDRLLVWNEIMREQSVRVQHVPQASIRLTGVPQFDVYREPGALASREAFCRRIGADPSSTIIFFGTEGSMVPHDGEIAEIIAAWIADGRFPFKAHLHVRPHYAHAREAEKIARLRGAPHVSIDPPPRMLPGVFHDTWDPGREDLLQLAEDLAYAAVAVVSASTLAIDAACMDVPVVNAAFDGRATLPERRSVRTWFGTEYYREIIALRATAVAVDADALFRDIVDAVEHPEAAKTGLARLRARFAEPLDGKSAARVADEVLSMIEGDV